MTIKKNKKCMYSQMSKKWKKEERDFHKTQRERERKKKGSNYYNKQPMQSDDTLQHTRTKKKKKKCREYRESDHHRNKYSISHVNLERERWREILCFASALRLRVHRSKN